MNNRLTKLIATIGPTSDSEEMIEKLIENHVNVFRFNFKHSDANWHKERLKRVKKIAARLKAEVATLLDLQGPEIRLTMPFEQIEVEADEKIILSQEVFKTKEKGFSLSSPEIISKLENGQKLLVDDNLLVFKVQKEKDVTYLISESKVIIKNRKTVNILNFDYDFPVINDRDREGLKLAKENEIDFIALSFVRNSNDLKILKKEMEKINFEANIVAKIETSKAIKNIDGIIDETDSVMVARGDLGVEMPTEEVPFYQKLIIEKCIEKGVPVITATQMLESMIESPNPTRAEVSDVANAVYDFTDSVMLSGETAAGKYPLQAVKVINKVTSFTEAKSRLPDIRANFHFELQNKMQMISDSAFNLYKIFQLKNKEIKGFIIFTQTGKTARLISRYRPHIPIFAFSPSTSTVKGLLINFGITPILQEPIKEMREISKEDIMEALDTLNKYGFAEKEDTFIILHGDHWASDKGASTIRLISY